jgi:hypothetical protein
LIPSAALALMVAALSISFVRIERVGDFGIFAVLNVRGSDLMSASTGCR